MSNCNQHNQHTSTREHQRLWNQHNIYPTGLTYLIFIGKQLIHALDDQGQLWKVYQGLTKYNVINMGVPATSQNLLTKHVLDPLQPKQSFF